MNTGTLQRFTGKKSGYIQLGFENANRTPSFIFNNLSNFYLLHTPVDFKKENSTHFFGSLYLPFAKLRLAGSYYLMTNYSYVSSYYKLEQQEALFNVLQLTAQKTFKIGRRWYWHADLYFQQVIGNAPVNLPQVYTRNRFAYEGNLGFKNLDIAMGAELRYHTPYNADGYSPALGQFYYQDSLRIAEKLPDIAAYIQFRIKGVKIYFRAENLNTMEFQGRNFGFTNNNLAAPGYPYPGFVIRLGVFWSFVN